MPEPITLNLKVPVASVELANPGEDGQDDALGDPSEIKARLAEIENIKAELTAEKQQIGQALAAIEKSGSELEQFYQQSMNEYPAQVVGLGVEIARRILAGKIEAGEYDIEAIIERAVDAAPVKEDITIRLNGKDIETLTANGAENVGRLKGVKLVADDSIGRAECVVDTPRGIVDYFVEDQLKRIVDIILNTASDE
ncbi:flagellar assembly protein H [Anaerohalosphaera lusitana]|uniref:Flagellar assembly protein FliH n=1 Tax=Anaerohalosphaera lusitana TaxID=1936003 RepID=A0A1U9NHB1_9BACT|nr:FliH/SctL family protein [Anaerohalosphaera lusitana]AQT66896.1 flagellar assembly protein H [Anaerohalosphaera lusitana]